MALAGVSNPYLAIVALPVLRRGLVSCSGPWIPARSEHARVEERSQFAAMFFKNVSSSARLRHPGAQHLLCGQVVADRVGPLHWGWTTVGDAHYGAAFPARRGTV